MEIRCKATKRFLIDINVEEYVDKINKLIGADIKLGIEVKIPCPKCKMVEVYEVYPTHYIHTRSYKLQ